MPLVKVLRSRGSVGWVEAHGEVLFAIGGDVTQWNRNFSRRVTRMVSQAAPTNKRPRWGHYGKPLKRTFTSTTKPVPSSLMVHSAVGSTAPHAVYVDQGTGVYGGNGPYQAKILPPWTRQSPSLYEHTWNVPEVETDRHGKKYIRWVPQGTVTVKGQRGQQFFERGLRDAFASVGMPTIQVPGEPKALKLFPDRLANFVGNTPATGAFRAQLEEWRKWRDVAWANRDVLGLGINRERRRRELKTVRRDIIAQQIIEERRAASRRRSQKFRDRKKAEAAAAARIEQQKKREAQRRAAAAKALDKARQRRALQAKLIAERREVEALMRSKYKGLSVIVGTRRKDADGDWVYSIRVVRGGKTVLDFPYASDYGAL